MQNLSYHVVEDVVNNNEATVSAAEAHGMLAGMLCVNKDVAPEDWLIQVFGDDRNELTAEEEETMKDLFEETCRLMQAVDFSFKLFLPDDDELLTERARALSGWCQGFLYGIGFAHSQDAWPGDCEEVLHDLADISRLDENASGEEDELAYAEISEFVRISVQLIRGDMQPPPVKSYLH
jgi:yecA family protein